MEKKTLKSRLLLALGVFVLPYIFTWFTLKKGYSNLYRIISFLWLALSIAAFLTSTPNSSPTNPQSSNQVAQQVNSEQQAPANDQPRKESNNAQTQVQWYAIDGLQNKGALDWQVAPYQQKLGSAANMYASLYQNKKLVPAIEATIHNVDDLRPYAEHLVAALDSAFKKQPTEEKNRMMYANQKVSETATILLAMEGHLQL